MISGATWRDGHSWWAHARAELLVGVTVAVLAVTADLRSAIGFSSFAVLIHYAIANASALTLCPDEGRPAPPIPVLGVLGRMALAFALPLDSAVAGAGDNRLRRRSLRSASHLERVPAATLRAHAITDAGRGLPARNSSRDFAIPLEAFGVAEGVVQDQASRHSPVRADQLVCQLIPRRFGRKDG